jgi:hypothetical protein
MTEQMLPTRQAREDPVQLLQDPPAKGPPFAYVLIADWCNFVAGICLSCAFFLGGLIFDRQTMSMPSWWLEFFFNTEGALYAIGCFFMIPIMAHTNNPWGTMQFAILTVGGIFFSFSGLIVPACITSLWDVFSADPCVINKAPMVWNAFAHFGITCFMAGTAMGQSGVMSLPKNKFISPFWGITFYTLGAYTIGIFKFWGPVFVGGTSWTWTWWLGLLGALYLTTGAFIFGIMDKSFTFGN